MRSLAIHLHICWLNGSFCLEISYEGQDVPSQQKKLSVFWGWRSQKALDVIWKEFLAKMKPQAWPPTGTWPVRCSVHTLTGPQKCPLSLFVFPMRSLGKDKYWHCLQGMLLYFTHELLHATKADFFYPIEAFQTNCFRIALGTREVAQSVKCLSQAWGPMHSSLVKAEHGGMPLQLQH